MAGSPSSRRQERSCPLVDDALAEWGEAGLVDIIGCLGNFSQVDLKPGDPEPFTDMRAFAKICG